MTLILPTTKGNSFMRPDILLWDMDGTLFNTYPPIRQAVSAAFAVHGIQVDPVRVAQLLADTFDSCIITLAEENGLDPKAVRTTYSEYAVLIRPETQPPFPGVVELCLRVIREGGCNLIYTHRERASLDRFLTLYDMTRLFRDTLTIDEDMPRKPDPTGFLTLLERNRLDPARVMAVGDRDLDIQAGINAGIMTCFFAPEDFPGGVPGLESGADYVVHSYAELEKLLFGAGAAR